MCTAVVTASGVLKSVGVTAGVTGAISATLRLALQVDLFAGLCLEGLAPLTLSLSGPRREGPINRVGLVPLILRLSGPWGEGPVDRVVGFTFLVERFLVSWPIGHLQLDRWSEGDGRAGGSQVWISASWGRGRRELALVLLDRQPSAVQSMVVLSDFLAVGCEGGLQFTDELSSSVQIELDGGELLATIGRRRGEAKPLFEGGQACAIREVDNIPLDCLDSRCCLRTKMGVGKVYGHGWVARWGLVRLDNTPASLGTDPWRQWPNLPGLYK